MALTHYSTFSMITLRMLVSKSGVLKKIILSKHGTKANIISTKMTNNLQAYNRDVLQSYWTSDGLLLFCSQPTGEKTHANQQCEKPRETSDLDDRTLQCLVRQMQFATSPVLKITLAAQYTSVNKNS